jgi:hypothetical protein
MRQQAQAKTEEQAAAQTETQQPATQTEEQAAETQTTEQPATETKTDQQAVKTDAKTEEQQAAESGQTVASQPDATAPAQPQMLTMEERRKAAVPFTERKMAMSSAELIGSDVYGKDNSSIGEIDDIIVSSDDTPAYALISYGGFLGLGEDQAAVPVSELRVSEDNYFFVDFTAEQLQAAPKLARRERRLLQERKLRHRVLAEWPGAIPAILF